MEQGLPLLALLLITHAVAIATIGAATARGHRAALAAAGAGLAAYAIGGILAQLGAERNEDSSSDVMKLGRLIVPSVYWTTALGALAIDRYWGSGRRNLGRYGWRMLAAFAVAGTAWEWVQGTAGAATPTHQLLLACYALIALPAIAMDAGRGRRNIRREDVAPLATLAIAAAAAAHDACWPIIDTALLPLGAMIGTSGLLCGAIQRARTDEQADEEVAHNERTAARIRNRLIPTGAGDTTDERVGFAHEQGTNGAIVRAVFRRDKQRFAVVLAEVEGAPLEAAIEAASLKNAIERRQAYAHDPTQVLAGIAAERGSEGATTVVRIAYAYVNADTGTVRLSNAGLPATVMHARKEHATSEHASNGEALGIERSSTASCELPLQPGDRLAIVTRGVETVRNAKGKDFGSNRVAATLLEESNEDSAMLSTQIVERARTWGGANFRPTRNMTAVTIVMPPADAGQDNSTDAEPAAEAAAG